MLKILAFINFLMVYTITDASIMLWSNKQIAISPLQVFNDKTLSSLKEKLNMPKVIIFLGDFNQIEGNLPKTLEHEQSFYVPNADLNAENATILSGNDMDIIEEQLNSRNEENYIAIMIDERRIKRSILDATDFPSDIPADGILYNDTNEEAMIYSSKPPQLMVNERNDTLGKAAVVTLDKRDSYTRVSVNIPVEDGKIILRFKISWSGGYWSFVSLDVLTTDSKTYNLTTSTQIMAPKRFSYHCKDVTLFSSEDGNVTLQMFDLQMQPDATKLRFGDAYDCVTFMTAPIWSGLFVTFIMMTVLGLGLGALGSIKTMDKFETNKSKQLFVTVNE